MLQVLNAIITSAPSKNPQFHRYSTLTSFHKQQATNPRQTAAHSGCFEAVEAVTEPKRKPTMDPQTFRNFFTSLDGSFRFWE